MGKWYSNTVPKCKAHKCSDEVLVTVEHKDYQGKAWFRVVKAVYIPFHHCTVEDMCWCFPDGVPDEWEYIEEEDTWWIPEGWYETADYFEDAGYATITDRVTAWMKLPKAYESKVKEFL